MYEKYQFIELIVRPACKMLTHWSEGAEMLLVLTAAQESLGGTYLKQTTAGGAVGAWQMEEATYNDIWNNFMPKTGLEATVINSVNMISRPPFEMMMHNVFYAAIMARIFYLRAEEAIPEDGSIETIAAYYKKYWNTPLGKATVEEAIHNYNIFMGLK